MEAPLRQLHAAGRRRDRQLPRRLLPRARLADRRPVPEPRLSSRSVTPSFATRSPCWWPIRMFSLPRLAASPMPFRGEAMARFLRGADVAQAQGFFLNSTHFDWMTHELWYGQQISRILGGTHFIINSGENGCGPLRTQQPRQARHGGSVQPAGRGLGSAERSAARSRSRPSTPTSMGFLWFSNPGGSGGKAGRARRRRACSGPLTR